MGFFSIVVRRINADRYALRPMKTLSIFATLTMLAFNAQATDDIASIQIKQLYSCYHFYEVGTRSTDQALSTKSTDLSNQFLLKATALAVDSGGEENANKLSLEAQSELRLFLARLQTVSGENRNRVLGDFNTSCSTNLNARVEYKKRIEPTKVERLFSCAHFYKSTEQSSDPDEREKLAQLSDEFSSKAKALAFEMDGGQSESDLLTQGETKSAAFLAGLNDSTNESTKEARLRKFKRLCAIAGKTAPK